MDDGIVFTTQELEDALQHAVDILGRCLCPFFLLGETARSIIQDNLIQGKEISLGVRERDYVAGTKSSLVTFAGGVDLNLGIKDFTEFENGVSWNYRRVPIVIQVVHRNYSFFNNPDHVFYLADEYKIPNPFDKYYKARYIIK